MGAATVDLNVEGFKNAVEKGGTLLIDFWAEWCGPCRMFGPIYEEVAKENPDATFAKVDTEEQQELAAALQIQSIPTLMIFRDRVLLFRQAGALPREALRELVKQVKALDMDEVRKQIAADEAGQGHEHAHAPDGAEPGAAEQPASPPAGSGPRIILTDA